MVIKIYVFFMIFEMPEDPQKGPWIRVTNHFLILSFFGVVPGPPPDPVRKLGGGPGGAQGAPFRSRSAVS